MTQSPDQMMREKYTLTTVKSKINRIENAASYCYNDSSIREAKDRLFNIQKLVSEALTECEK